MIGYLIVGAKFRPPARGLLDTLPLGARLLARREGSNAHDANAIQVLVRSEDFQPVSKEMEIACEGFGFGARQLESQPEWHLGYIPREKAAELAPRLDALGLSELEGQLSFSAQGLPLIALPAEDL